MSTLEQKLKILEERIEELTGMCNSYQQHNSTLRTRETELTEERSNLLRKNDMARSKVEAMISRLRTLEQDQ